MIVWEGVRVWCVYVWRITHMDPAKGNEVILVLDIKDLLFTERLTWVGTSCLLGNDDVGHPQYVLWLCEHVKKWRCVKREVGEVYNHKSVGWSWMGWGVRCVRGMVLTVQAPLSLQSSISPLHAYHTDCADSTTTTPGHVPPCCESVNSTGRREFTQSAKPLRIGRKAPEYTAESHWQSTHLLTAVYKSCVKNWKHCMNIIRYIHNTIF